MQLPISSLSLTRHLIEVGALCWSLVGDFIGSFVHNRASMRRWRPGQVPSSGQTGQIPG
jgi:hypothetical protein